MARRPAWYDRLDAEILPAARRFPAPELNRVDLETLFQTAERDAYRLLQRLGARAAGDTLDDGLAQFSEQHKRQAAQLLATAAALERDYQAFRADGNRQGFQPQVNQMGKLHRQWLSDLESFKSSLRAQGVEPRALEYVNEAFGRFAERIKKLSG
jgi:hypothetical protein